MYEGGKSHEACHVGCFHAIDVFVSVPHISTFPMIRFASRMIESSLMPRSGTSLLCPANSLAAIRRQGLNYVEGVDDSGGGET